MLCYVNGIPCVICCYFCFFVLFFAILVISYFDFEDKISVLIIPIPGHHYCFIFI